MATKFLSKMTREELEQLTIQLLTHDTPITSDRVSYDSETGKITVHPDSLQEADQLLETAESEA